MEASVATEIGRASWEWLQPDIAIALAPSHCFPLPCSCRPQNRIGHILRDEPVAEGWRCRLICANADGVTLAVAEKQLEEDNRQIERLRAAITTAKQSPYYLNATGNSRLSFAFVPYDDQASAKPGAPIYDCYLNLVACRKVGTVKQVFLGEQDIVHPIFKTQVRGFMIQMDLSRPASAQSKTVFLGRKPLLF